jgi:CheY-like chemotaxis protein
MTRRGGGPASRVGRILVVEDSPSARRLLQDVLIRLGAELPNLRVAGTVVEALTLFAQWRPNLVFLDIQLRAPPPSALPGSTPAPSPNDPKDGVEMAIAFLQRNPGVRIVLCSATDPSDARVSKLLSDRKVEFIVKPLVAARVEEVLSRRVVGDMPADL